MLTLLPRMMLFSLCPCTWMLIVALAHHSCCLLGSCCAPLFPSPCNNFILLLPRFCVVAFLAVAQFLKQHSVFRRFMGSVLQLVSSSSASSSPSASSRFHSTCLVIFSWRYFDFAVAVVMPQTLFLYWCIYNMWWCCSCVFVVVLLLLFLVCACCCASQLLIVKITVLRNKWSVWKLDLNYVFTNS